jgi:hypothetical protein
VPETDIASDPLVAAIRSMLDYLPDRQALDIALRLAARLVDRATRPAVVTVWS